SEEVELELPNTLFGKDPRGFLEFIGLHGQPLGNSRWKVKPNNDRIFISQSSGRGTTSRRSAQRHVRDGVQLGQACGAAPPELIGWAAFKMRSRKADG